MTATPRPSLGAADRAILVRLRAIALLLRAAAVALPDADGIEIGLYVTPNGRLRPLQAVSWNACHLLARAGGWSDSEELLAVERRVAFYTGTLDRTAEGEFPQAGPPALVRLLRRVGLGRPLALAAAQFLAEAGWEIASSREHIRPIVPHPASAHEVLDAWAAADAVGGLGSGPLARLAQAAALAQGLL